jgi:hypothetical protein
MSEAFVNGMMQESNWKLTENGADALRSTNSSLLDLFGTIGALRNRDSFDIEQMFSKAFSEDRLLSVKMAFYCRNVRGGLGERETARVIWKWLAQAYPGIMRMNLGLIPQFGRWDDLYEFVGTSQEELMWQFMRQQFEDDMKDMKAGKSVSLLGKWLKSTNTSSSESSKLGKLTAKKFGLTEKQYRKALSALRAKIDVAEKKMSAGDWDAIKYQAVSSNAMTRYRKAFQKHDPEGFAAYMVKVEKGEAEIKSGTLYPYDIVEKIMSNYSNSIDKVLEEQWKALPNYVEGENNILVMADVSGSMSGRPMATSVGLAIYFAERNKGVFHDKFLTFSGEPDFVSLKGNTLHERVKNAMSASWQTNTNIEKAFKKILDVAVQNKLAQADLPKSLLIISDMEFDASQRAGMSWRSESVHSIPKYYHQHMSEMYAEAGYELPRVIYWNVDARQNTYNAQAEDGVQFASGQSTSVFKSIISGASLTAYDLMLEVLNSPAYECIKV